MYSKIGIATQSNGYLGFTIFAYLIFIYYSGQGRSSQVFTSDSIFFSCRDGVSHVQSQYIQGVVD